MPRAINHSGPSPVEIEYAFFGDASDASKPAMLLVNGFTSQMVWWHPEFIDALVEAGFFVLTYDNRDVGLSTWFDGAPSKPAPYTLGDMARDGATVLDDMDVEHAHIVGASMGGMIAQTFAIDMPDRCLSMVSIMSRTGARDFGRSTPEANAALMAAPPADRDAYIEQGVASSKVYSSKTLFDADLVARKQAVQYDRAYHPEGAFRQMAAIIVSGDREAALATLSVPTLALHGLDDTLIQPSGSERLAEIVPGCELVLVPEMGHDMPIALIPQIVATIADFCHRHD